LGIPVKWENYISEESSSFGLDDFVAPYVYSMGINKNMEENAIVKYNSTMVSRIEYFTQHKFTYRLELDSLPSATVVAENKHERVNYHSGIPIGSYNEERHEVTIYNHLDLTVRTHKQNNGMYRVVGLEVEPFSLAEDEDRFLSPET